jgi:hypothetical protein
MAKCRLEQPNGTTWTAFELPQVYVDTACQTDLSWFHDNRGSSCDSRSFTPQPPGTLRGLHTSAAHGFSSFRDGPHHLGSASGTQNTDQIFAVSEGTPALFSQLNSHLTPAVIPETESNSATKLNELGLQHMRSNDSGYISGTEQAAVAAPAPIPPPPNLIVPSSADYGALPQNDYNTLEDREFELVFFNNSRPGQQFPFGYPVTTEASFLRDRSVI